MSHDILFQLEFFFLIASAQIAATLTGFIGVVFVLGDRASGRLNSLESSALFHFMFAGMAALFLSLVSAGLLVCLADQEDLAWRLACGAHGFAHLVGAGRLASDISRQEAGLSGALATCVTGLTVGCLCVLIAFGLLESHQVSVLLVATLWTLGVTVISFASLLRSPRHAT